MIDTTLTRLLGRITATFEEFGIQGLKPSLAFITTDCRDAEERQNDLSGQVGIHLGKFHFPSVLKLHRGEPDDTDRLYDALVVQPEEYDSESEFDIGNPLIVGKNGEFIWGVECWWADADTGDLQILQQAFEDLGISHDPEKFELSSRDIIAAVRRRLEEELDNEQT